MSAPLLSLRDLSVTFRRNGVQTRAVRNLSLDIAAGETVALVGESGSGKSVSALASLGLLPDNAGQGGSVVWKGAKIDRGDAAAMRRLRGNEIGMINKFVNKLVNTSRSLPWGAPGAPPPLALMSSSS